MHLETLVQQPQQQFQDNTQFFEFMRKLRKADEEGELDNAEGTVMGVKACTEGTIDTTLFLVPPYKAKGKSFFQKLT